MAEKRNRPRRNITLPDDAWERLNDYAKENHIPNGASGAIERLIWSEYERKKVLEELKRYGVLASDERSLEELKVVLKIVSED